MMALDLNPDGKKLRHFGLLCLPGFGLMGWLAHSHGFAVAASVFWALAVLCPLIGLIAPRALLLVYRVLTVATYPVGLVAGNLALALIFFGMFMPLAVLFRLLGRDALRRRWRSGAASYWIASGKARPPEDYYRQF